MNLSKKLGAGIVVACVALLGGVLLGGTAVAKKKKNSNTANVSASARPIVQATGAGPTLRYGVTPVTFKIGKKFKGRKVSADSVILTYSLAGGAGSLDDYELFLSNPKGRTVGLTSPGDPASTTIGPLTETPNSPFLACTAPPCENPFRTVVAPAFVGTIGDVSLASFTGTSMRGNWVLNIIDTDPNNGADSLTSAKLSVKAEKTS